MDKEGSRVDLKRKFADVVNQAKRPKTMSKTVDHSELERSILRRLEIEVKEFDPNDTDGRSSPAGFLLFRTLDSHHVPMSDIDNVRHYSMWYRDKMKTQIEAMVGDANALRFHFMPFMKSMIIRCYVKQDNGYTPVFGDSDYEEPKE